MALVVATAFGVLSGSPSHFESNDGNMVVVAHNGDSVSTY
jgi:hypothetical protein